MNDRITIRLDPKDIESIDAYVRSTDEFSNRSEFLRAASLRYIQETGRTRWERGGEVTVTLPGALRGLVDYLVMKEEYGTRSEACRDLIRQGVRAIGANNLTEEADSLETAAMAVEKVRKYQDTLLSKYHKL